MSDNDRFIGQLEDYLEAYDGDRADSRRTSATPSGPRCQAPARFDPGGGRGG